MHSCHHRISVFHSCYLANGMRTTQIIFIGLRYAPMKDFPFINQFLHHLSYCFRRNSRINTVLEIQIYIICFQTLQRTFCGFTYHFRSYIWNEVMIYFSIRFVNPDSRQGMQKYLLQYISRITDYSENDNKKAANPFRFTAFADLE